MRAMVTGVSAGIGGAICTEIAWSGGKGAAVALCVRRKTSYVDRLAVELAAMGATSSILYGDLNDPAVPAKLVAEAAEALGGLAPYDVARAVWYLASPENRYSTGLDLLVDGGLGGSILGHIPGAPAPKS